MPPLVSRQMTSEGRLQKFQTDDASDWLKQISHAAWTIENTNFISEFPQASDLKRS